MALQLCIFAVLASFDVTLPAQADLYEGLSDIDDIYQRQELPICADAECGVYEANPPKLSRGKIAGAVAAAVATFVILALSGSSSTSSTSSTSSAVSQPVKIDESKLLQDFDITGMATPKCWKNKTFYVEMNGEFAMPGSSKTPQATPAACQLLCATTFGCEHFSYWKDGGCLLTSYNAFPKSFTGPNDNAVISGPRKCLPMNDGPTMVFEGSALGLPPFHAHRATGCESLHDEYQLAWKAQGETFFDDWQFINKSETRGAEWYLNKSEAFHQGVVHASKAGAILRVGEQVQPFKRRSVMLHSAQAWRPDVGFIVAMKYNHVPYGAGVWPAFWMVNSDVSWPKGGELDILEYANDEENKVTFHTDQKCKMNITKLKKCSKNIKNIDPKMILSCYTNYSGNELGCMPPQVRKDGEWFAKNPGVIALLWDASGITSFHIPASEIPADLESDLPQPNTWKDDWRMAFMPFDAETCMNIARPQEIVLNIALCGDWAGNSWFTSETCKATGYVPNYCIPGHVTEPATDCCTLYVSNPSAEEPLKTQAYFDIDYIKVFEPKGITLPRYPAGTYRNGGVFVGDV
ncbi:unnamed protein product [Effrenium voratum]|nr:unnamed protein product [Effrenium voratum]